MTQEPPFKGRPPLAAGGRVLPTGTRLQEFEVIGLVGQGGFGIVYLGFDSVLKRRVAVKEYMPPQASRVEGTAKVRVSSQQDVENFGIGLRSFVNEAQLLAQFDHPALVKVHRFWEENGTAYMVMPFYDGPTLQHTFAEKPGSTGEASLRKLLNPLLDAVALLHSKGCYHRDVSPDNILLTATGPVLLDFGAARQAIGDATHTFTAILKEGYAPVEQYGQMRQGPWTDIYALAGVLRYAITGKRPVSAFMRLAEGTDPLEPLSRISAGRYSKPFLHAIDRGMALKPEDRPQNIGEFRALLERGGNPVAIEQDDSETVSSAAATVLRQVPKGRRLGAAVLGGVLAGTILVAAFGSGYWFLHPISSLQTPDSPQESMSASVPTVSGHSVGEAFRDCEDVCPEMVVIPPGRFQMGSPDDEPGREKSEGPVHEVRIEYAFAVGKYPVTRGEWRKYVAKSGRSAKDCAWETSLATGVATDYNWQNPGFPQKDSHPVVCVVWEDAQDYANWLSERTGHHYRLLSEAEYEYVNRAGSSSAYFWGSAWNCRYANGDVCKGGYRYTSPVGSYQPNNFGLYDTTTNGWSWTQDCWHKNYDGAPTDGSAWTSGRDCDGGRVIRGSIRYKALENSRAASRDYLYGSGLKSQLAGFRLARTD
jgi:formylglycine-generating enzyme required for sulfatase activity